MAYAIIIPTTFGKFRPQAMWPVWKEQVDYSFENLLTDEERDQYLKPPYFHTYDYAIYQKFTKGTAPVRDWEWPEEWLTKRAFKDLGAIIYHEGVTAVRAEIKEAIEALEPNVHQFNPLRVSTRSGKVYPGPHYAMCPRNYLDCFDPDRSDPESFDKRHNIYTTRGNNFNLEGLYLKQDVISGLHLWRIGNFPEIDLCFSDELAEAVRNLGLSFPKLWRLKDE